MHVVSPVAWVSTTTGRGVPVIRALAMHATLLQDPMPAAAVDLRPLPPGACVGSPSVDSRGGPYTCYPSEGSSVAAPPSVDVGAPSGSTMRHSRTPGMEMTDSLDSLVSIFNPRVDTG
jgi:hypothetical protein